MITDNEALDAIKKIHVFCTQHGTYLHRDCQNCKIYDWCYGEAVTDPDEWDELFWEQDDNE